MRITWNRQRGLTLVELMVALVVGMLITAAVLTSYVSVSRDYGRNERFAWMQENGRTALKVLADELSMADFWGKVMSTDTISTALAPPPGDCGVAVGLFDAADGLLFNNYHASPAATQFAPCGALAGDHVAGTDMVAIKRVQGTPTASRFVDATDTDGDGDTTEELTTGASALQAGVVYLRSNGVTGSLVDDLDSSNPPGLGESDWEYVPRVYFVRDHYEVDGDQIPALCRMGIDGTGLAATSCIAEGVEDLHLQFGVDPDADGVANRYVSSPTAAEMDSVVTVRVYVLVRSVDTEAFYTNDKTYTLGDVIRPAANDGFLRRVYSTTVALRNPLSRSLLN